MKLAGLRIAAFVVALAAGWAAVLLWAAEVDWRAPLSPGTVLSLRGNDFRAVFGDGEANASRLHVSADAEDHSALQVTTLAYVRAGDFPLLRYRFASFPRTLELALVFRTAEDPDDVQTIALPWPGEGTTTFDLSRVEAWHGTIIELGFSQFSTAQNVPPELGFKPFDLVEAALWSPSWQGDLAALATDWLGAWPWSQRSVHALGRDTDSPRARSIVVSAALAASLGIVSALLLFGRRRWQAVVMVFVALAWLLVDLRWQDGLAQRLELTRTLYADVEWPRRARIVGDADLVEAADEIRAKLVNEPGRSRVLVMAGTGYQLLRLVWHLLPMNTGSLAYALASGEELPEGCVLVFLDTDAWYRDPALRALLAKSQRITSTDPHAVHASGFEGSRIVLYRYRHAR